LVCVEGSQVTLDATLSRKGRGEERGDRAMTKPDTPFPRHWRYYIAIKWAVIAAAIVLALKLFGAF
jgi:hypothetical protein